MTGIAAERAPATIDDLEERLSRPTPGVLSALGHTEGDVIVLGAGGKMGPTLTRMVRRGFEQLGARRTVIAVSRFSSAEARQKLERCGVLTLRADLTKVRDITALPLAPNVIYLVGQKFGTSTAPWQTWLDNVVAPALVAERFASGRIVALSTGNVYPLVPTGSGGSREGDATAPIGEYAWSTLGRERVFEHASVTRRTPVAIVRLNYACDLRYGVLTDIACSIRDGRPVRLDMPAVNVIWQGDANARALQCLPLAATPPVTLNVTGADTLYVRDTANRFSELLDRPPTFTGNEPADALLSNARRSIELFGEPSVSTPALIAWTAEWVRSGMPTLDKPTGFATRDGAF